MSSSCCSVSVFRFFLSRVRSFPWRCVELTKKSSLSVIKREYIPWDRRAGSLINKMWNLKVAFNIYSGGESVTEDFVLIFTVARPVREGVLCTYLLLANSIVCLKTSAMISVAIANLHSKSSFSNDMHSDRVFIQMTHNGSGGWQNG